MELEYTHNLKIILLDENNNIVINNLLLNEIKNKLTNNITHTIVWNGQLLDFTIKWDKKDLCEINQALMGDLFSNPIYNSDRIILEHTEKTIFKIDYKCKYFVKFYISRIIYDKIIDKNSVGNV
jgi:hypothetical protein